MPKKTKDVKKLQTKARTHKRKDEQRKGGLREETTGLRTIKMGIRGPNTKKDGQKKGWTEEKTNTKSDV